MKKPKSKAVWLIGLMAYSLTFPAVAETVYKCVEGGKTNFTSKSLGENCQPVEVKVIQPDPQEVARQMEEKRRHEAEERAEAKKKKPVKDAETLWRERVHEEAMQLLREPVARGHGRKSSRGKGSSESPGGRIISNAKQSPSSFSQPPAKKH